MCRFHSFSDLCAERRSVDMRVVGAPYLPLLGCRYIFSSQRRGSARAGKAPVERCCGTCTGVRYVLRSVRGLRRREKHPARRCPMACVGCRPIFYIVRASYFFRSSKRGLSPLSRHACVRLQCQIFLCLNFHSGHGHTDDVSCLDLLRICVGVSAQLKTALFETP